MKPKTPIEVQRFIEVRKDNSYTQVQFAKVIGIKRTTADIERGKVKLSGKVVAYLYGRFKINPLWLYGMSLKKEV